MSGQWVYEGLLTSCIGGPRPRGDAYLWPWKLVSDKLIEACDVLEESFTARRSLLFNNPALPMGGTTHTMLMGIQMIKPGGDRLGPPAHAGGDPFCRQRRRQSIHRRQRREMSDGNQ